MTYQEENKYSHLEELHGSDYQIVEGEPDISGWEVIDGEGRRIGEVDDVLFDPQTRDVRYIIVDLDQNELDIEADKKVLIPIGIAELRDQYDDDTTETDTLAEIDQADDQTIDDDGEIDDEVVYLPAVTAAHLLALPAYEKGGPSPEHETAVRSVFDSSAPDTIILYDKDSFYTHEHFNNNIYPREDRSTEDPERGTL
ncbi:MAG: PRC-barrel domain containing protein [Chitinophagaceae bacterium]|nr:MAG: PRC-barrel domain containing protein [Chitinophagaceae bacterium]